jgi:outer membrane lipoprotein-sorting protein
MQAKAPALAGTVAFDNQLGLTQVPGVGTLAPDSARVYHDGQGRSRANIVRGSSEQTVVHDGSTVWTYDSKDNTATKATLPPGAGEHSRQGPATDPAGAAAGILAKVKETSTVAVDGTDRVAGRPVYELVLTPKPTERTLLREARVAIDAETRMPLQAQLMSNGAEQPVLSVGFTQLELAPQPASEFAFAPPKGAAVTEKQLGATQGQHEQLPAGAEPRVVGDGWDTVLTGQLPKGALAGGPQGKPGEQGKQGEQARGEGIDPRAVLDRISKPVSGPFGTGHLITTKAGTALLLDDGRYAVGAVPQQVLIEALGAK